METKEYYNIIKIYTNKNIKNKKTRILEQIHKKVIETRTGRIPNDQQKFEIKIRPIQMKIQNQNPTPMTQIILSIIRCSPHNYIKSIM